MVEGAAFVLAFVILWECRLLAGPDKSRIGRNLSAAGREGLHTSRLGSRWLVWSGDRSQSHHAV